MESKKKRPRCHNCTYGGTHFKLGDKTYLHCESPAMKEWMEANEPNVWESLREFSDTCRLHEFKSEINEQQTESGINVN